MKEKLLLITIVLFTLFSCKENKNLVGPCVHTYKESILHIVSVKDTTKNTPINFVILKDVKINGILQYGANVFVKSYSIVANDSVFYCNIPFGFGVIKGKYEFTMEAKGFQPKYFVINDVDYSNNKGGCPSYSDGGKKVDLYLNQ